MSNRTTIKYQEGGQMGGEQEQFTNFLIEVLKPESSEQFEEMISNLSEDDLKELYKQFKNKTIAFAKKGAKLSTPSSDSTSAHKVFNMFVDHVRELNKY